MKIRKFRWAWYKKTYFTLGTSSIAGIIMGVKFPHSKMKARETLTQTYRHYFSSKGMVIMEDDMLAIRLI